MYVCMYIIQNQKLKLINLIRKQFQLKDKMLSLDVINA